MAAKLIECWSEKRCSGAKGNEMDWDKFIGNFAMPSIIIRINTHTCIHTQTNHSFSHIYEPKVSWSSQHSMHKRGVYNVAMKNEEWSLFLVDAMCLDFLSLGLGSPFTYCTHAQMYRVPAHRPYNKIYRKLRKLLVHAQMGKGDGERAERNTRCSLPMIIILNSNRYFPFYSFHKIRRSIIFRCTMAIVLSLLLVPVPVPVVLYCWRFYFNLFCISNLR